MKAGKTKDYSSKAPGRHYRLHEDFSIHDEGHKSYHIDIEKNTALSHAHARIGEDGKYHLMLNGNKHFLNTPELRDFRLETEFAMRVHECTFGCGFIYYFRFDRRSGRGHSLSCAWDKDALMRITLDGKSVHTRQCGKIPEFAAEKTVLELKGNRVFFEYNGEKLEFACAAGDDLPQRGEIGFDLLFSPGGLMKVSRITLDSDDPAAQKRLFKSFDFTLKRGQGFSVPLKYQVNLYKFQNGAVELEYLLDGTIRGRGKRLESGGGEWCYEIDKLTRPYIRIEADGREFRNILLANETLFLMDRAEQRPCRRLFPQIAWPLAGRLFFRAFPGKFTLAAGYEYACHDPWRIFANGPYELIKDQDNHTLYEGNSIRRDLIGIACQSPGAKLLTKRIPKNIVNYAQALKHAREQHYFFESETVDFSVELAYRQTAWEAGEFKIEFSFGDPFGRNLKNGAGDFKITGRAGQKSGAGIGRRTWRLRLKKNPGCGVYHLNVKVGNGFKELYNDFTVFEVMSDDPRGPCPPLAARLPFLLAMPNEIKYLEDDPFDPYGDAGGAGHYYCAVNRYPAVAGRLKIWELLRVYRRKWLLMLVTRNTGNPSVAAPANRELIANCDFIMCHDGYHLGRYDLFARTWYKGYIMEVLLEFVREKQPPFKIIRLADLEKLFAANKDEGVKNPWSDQNCLSREQFADLVATCWDDWTAYFRARVGVETRKFTEKLLALNPRIAPASYGPYSVYLSHYKSPYTLKYAGCERELDPRVRANGGFFFLEEYHYSCDYPLTRAAYFVAGYSLHFSSGRKLYPEVYDDIWEGCNDGAVYQAHPPHGFYSVPACHQRRIVYQFTYGSPQFKNGKYRYWEDYGFQMRNPYKHSLKEFLHAWGNLIDNQPARQLKAPFLMLDLEQIGRHGDYLDDQHAYKIGADIEWTDVCNTAEEALGHAYESLCNAGYNTPVLSTLAELDGITPDMAEMIILPPMVKGTPQKYLDAIRRAHARGINLLCFEQVCGLEDLFGVRERKGGAVKVVDIQGEVCEHKLALARYENHGGEVLLSGAAKVRGKANIPLAITRVTQSGRTAFLNIPPTLVRRSESYRSRLAYGHDSLSVCLGAAMRKIFAALCVAPAVHAERGTINAAYSVKGDVIAVLGDDSPISGDTGVYPASFRFRVSAPGIGRAAIESDAPCAVVSRTRDALVIRTQTEKDSALFFKFGPTLNQGK